MTYKTDGLFQLFITDVYYVTTYFYRCDMIDKTH